MTKQNTYETPQQHTARMRQWASETSLAAARGEIKELPYNRPMKHLTPSQMSALIQKLQKQSL